MRLRLALVALTALAVLPAMADDAPRQGPGVLSIAGQRGNITALPSSAISGLSPAATTPLNTPNGIPQLDPNGMIRSSQLTNILGGNILLNDAGRSGNDNAPSLTINKSEALAYTGGYVTNYGLILNNHELAGGTGDRVGFAAIQTCDATLAGKSCVGGSEFAVAGGAGAGIYTGSNPRVLIPAGLTGGGGVVGGEDDIETHSPMSIVNGRRIVLENQSGGLLYHGTVEDVGLIIVRDQSNTTAADGFKVGVQFGENSQGYPNSWPIVAGGSLLQANNPNIVLNYGFDLTGSTAGFTYGALMLPVNTPGAIIGWGYNHAGGQIISTATTNAGGLSITNAGTSLVAPNGSTIFSLTNAAAIAPLFQETLTTPASSSASCTAGQFTDDASFHYVCVAANTWKRAALSAF